MDPFIGIVLALLFAAKPEFVLSEATLIETDGRNISLNQLGEVRGLDARYRSIAVVRAPAPGRMRTLSRRQLGILIERRIPGLSVDVGEAPNTEVFLRRGMRAMRSVGPCYSLSVPVDEGAILSQGDVERVPCAPSSHQTPLTFDRRVGAVRVTAPLSAGTFLGQLSLPAERFADHGDRLLVGVNVGPVRIFRSVSVVEPSAFGDGVFVQDEDGGVFSVPLHPDTEKGDTP